MHDRDKVDVSMEERIRRWASGSPASFSTLCCSGDSGPYVIYCDRHDPDLLLEDLLRERVQVHAAARELLECLSSLHVFSARKAGRSRAADAIEELHIALSGRPRPKQTMQEQRY